MVSGRTTGASRSVESRDSVAVAMKRLQLVDSDGTGGGRTRTQGGLWLRLVMRSGRALGAIECIQDRGLEMANAWWLRLAGVRGNNGERTRMWR